MSADPSLPSDPPYLHFAAATFAYSMLNGSMTHGEAVAAIMRTAIRRGLLHDSGDASMQGVRDRLEVSLNRAIAEVSQAAADAVTSVTCKLIARPVRPTRALLQKTAYAANSNHGGALPRACVDWLVLEEVRVAVGMPRTREAGRA